MLSNNVGMLVHKPGSAVKAVPRGNGLVEGYIIAWGSPSDADLEGQFFTSDTDLRLEYFSDYPMLYHHGMDKDVGLDPIGRIKSVQKDNIGLWGQAQCDLANEYGQEVYNRVQQSKFGWSSGSIDHLVQVAKDGHILVWPLFEGSITPTPAQPHKTTVRALKSILLPDDPVNKYLRDLETSKEVHGTTARKTFDMGAMTMPSLKMKQDIARTMKKYGYKVDPAVVEAVAADLEEEAALSEDEALLSDDEFDPAAMGEFEDDAVMFEEEDPAAMSDFEDEDAALSDDEFDPAAMSDFEDEDAMLFAEEEDAPVMSSRKMQQRRTQKTQKRVKSADPTIKLLMNTVNDLAATVKALKEAPAPGQKTRGIKGMQYAEPIDHRGNKKAYKSVWEQAMRYGEHNLSETERNILRTGEDKFGAAAVKYVKTADGQFKAIKSLNTSNAGSMGFAVPEDYLERLNQNIMVNAQTAAECQKQSTSSDLVKFPSVNTPDARRAFPGHVSWVNESPASASDSDITEVSLNQEAIPVHIMLVNTTATYSSLEDVSFDLSKMISDQFSEASAIELETLIPSGNGQNKLAGITTDTRVSGSASTGVSSVGGYIASGDASDILSGDPLIDMLMHLPPQYRQKSKWYMNSNTANKIKKLKDGFGRYLWGDEQGLNQGIPTTLLNRPIVYNEFMDDVGAGTFPIILGDMYRGYMIVNRVEFSIKRFDDATYAARDLAFFIGRARLGGQVIAPYAFKLLKIAAS